MVNLYLLNGGIYIICFLTIFLVLIVCVTLTYNKKTHLDFHSVVKHKKAYPVIKNIIYIEKNIFCVERDDKIKVYMLKF